MRVSRQKAGENRQAVLDAAARLFRQHGLDGAGVSEVTREAGPVRVVADRYTALQLITYGDIYVATPSAGFPAALLVQTPDDPSRELAGMLYASHYDYVVVDTRMTQQPAFNGDNFGSTDPLPGRPTPPAYLNRLDTVPWASRILATDHLRVYRLDLLLLGQTLRSGS